MILMIFDNLSKEYNFKRFFYKLINEIRFKFSYMYPTISDLLLDLFGFNLQLPIQTFGFFMALSFGAAYWFTSQELKDKEANGLLKSFQVKEKINVKITIVDYATQTIIYAFVGFKLLEMFLDYDSLVANPQKFLLSGKGSWFGALAGGVFGYYSTSKEAKALEGKTPATITKIVHPYQLMGNIVGIAAIGGILGAKIFHNLENLDEFAADPMGSLLSFSGLTFYGGLIVAAIGILYYTSKHQIKWYHMIDSAAVGLMIAYGIGRVGCHLSGDGDWGIDNLSPKPDALAFLPDWFWSYKYPHNVLGEGIPIPGCVGNHCAQLANPVYPTPLYEAIVCIGLAFVLWFSRKKFKTPGVFFFTYLIFNGIERFTIEKIRVNTTYNILGHGITQAEIISFVFILMGIVGVFYMKTRFKNKLE